MFLLILFLIAFAFVFGLRATGVLVLACFGLAFVGLIGLIVLAAS